MTNLTKLFSAYATKGVVQFTLKKVTDEEVTISVEGMTVIMPATDAKIITSLKLDSTEDVAMVLYSGGKKAATKESYAEQSTKEKRLSRRANGTSQTPAGSPERY